jgi:hypothetical protein
MPLTEKQKSQIKVRFQELKGRLTALLGARNEWEKPELGKNRDWRKIAEAYWELVKRFRQLNYKLKTVVPVMPKDNPLYNDIKVLFFERNL